jgi:SAM-dependent methyltransferase
MIRKIKRLFAKRKIKNGLKANFKDQYKQLLHLEKETKKRFDLDERDFFPCLNDNTKETGFDRHYVYHPAWAARIIKKNNPKKHIDISSTLHFCSILSTFIPVDFYDYRPADLYLTGLKSLHGDLMNLPFESNSVESISCMHTIEHVGLGRYGDPMDYDGDIKAINELKRVLAPNGSLFFVVPMGRKNQICFNAHRIYTKELVLNLFSDLELNEFALIPEDGKDGGLIIDPTPQLLATQSYGCGCFWFTKKDAF